MREQPLFPRSELSSAAPLACTSRMHHKQRASVPIFAHTDDGPMLFGLVQPAVHGFSLLDVRLRKKHGGLTRHAELRYFPFQT